MWLATRELSMLHECRRRHEEAETVSYSGPHLAELLAASGESPVLTAEELECVESIECDDCDESIEYDDRIETMEFDDRIESFESLESIESTVVIAGSRPISLPLFAAPQRWESSSYPAAFTVSQPVIVEAPRRAVGRSVAGSLVGIGLLLGLFTGTAFSTEASRPARAPATQVQPSVVLAQPTPLVSPTHQKVATKKKGRVVGNVARPVAHSTATATAPPPPANEAADDAQQAEDRRLVLAAQAERSL
jgi:hypothetical protein